MTEPRECELFPENPRGCSSFANISAPVRRILSIVILCWLAALPSLCGQSIAIPWSSHAHDPQHTGISQFSAQPLQQIHWQMPVDLQPNYSGDELLIHYGSPLITRNNTLLVAVKTGLNDGFRIEARNAANGTSIWTAVTGYSVPQSGWIPACGIVLTPKNRLYYPDAGGTVSFRDTPDAATGNTGRVAFYGIANYNANQATFNANVKICTPLTSDRYGNIFFGFLVSGSTSPSLSTGIARITPDGTGSWVSASAAASDAGITEVVANCAPALSNDHRTLYIAVSSGSFSSGYLLALDSRTLATQGVVRLKDVKAPTQNASLPDQGTSSPCIGPDGDVYFGVLENPFGSNHFRGWLLHFDKTLAQSKPAGAFGWDDTPSIVAASAVPSYHGTSSYLLLTKYNDYANNGGTGLNKVAILDPNDTIVDPETGATVMKEIITVLGPTRDTDYPAPAVKEWCINTVAIDTVGKCACVHSEDGNVYRWDFTTNTFTQTLNLTSGLGEAYTPSVIGVDGTVFVIANAILFGIGN